MGLLGGLFSLAVDVVKLPVSTAVDILNIGDDKGFENIEKNIEDIGEDVEDIFDL